MFKRVVITIDNFNNDKSVNENTVLLSRLLSRVEQAMNEATDFPVYVAFDIYGGSSQTYIIMSFMPKGTVNDDEDDETSKEDSFDDLAETIDTLMQNSTNHEYDIEKFKNDVGELNTVVNKNSVDIDTLTEKFYVESNNIKNLNNDIENLNNKVRIIEKAISINMKDIDGLLDKIDNLNGTISRLEKQQYEIMKSINRIEALEEACKHNLNGLEAIDRRIKKLEEIKS